MTYRGKVTFADELIEYWQCQECQQMYEAHYDVVLREMKPMERTEDDC
jgi:hypothetical protein